MTTPELAQLELLAEVDAIAAGLARWADSAPAWQPAETCQALVRRVVQRAESLRLRLESPLVVATLGGTGTGKSTLVNALVGEQVVPVGKARPTTTYPILICRPDLTPEMLGIPAASVQLVQRAVPALEHLVLIDCPDPDTTEDAAAPGTSLARLRPILPHCDVLLVVTTQQKYRSARVGDELAAAAPGRGCSSCKPMRMSNRTFATTGAACSPRTTPPANCSTSIRCGRWATGCGRPEWMRVLRNGMNSVLRAAISPGSRICSPGQLSGGAGNRIRRANFLDLVDDTLASAAARLAAAMPAVEQLWDAIDHQRAALGVRLARQTHDELLVHRRQWESRLVAQGRLALGLQSVFVGLARVPGIGRAAFGRLAVSRPHPGPTGVVGRLRGGPRLAAAPRPAAGRAGGGAGRRHCWEKDQLHGAALVLAGYAAEAGIERPAATRGKTDIPVGLEAIDEEAGRSTLAFAGEVSAALDRVLDRLAARHSGFFTRWFYELLLLAMLGFLGFRLAKNFFYDTWLGVQPYGLDFYVQSAFWLLAWCLLLYWMFAARLRRGLRREIDQLAQKLERRDPGRGAVWPAPTGLPRHRAVQRRTRRFPPPRGPVTRSLGAARGPAGPGPGGAASPGFLSRSIRRSRFLRGTGF